jgi:hypothetical protein
LYGDEPRLLANGMYSKKKHLGTGFNRQDILFWHNTIGSYSSGSDPTFHRFGTDHDLNCLRLAANLSFLASEYELPACRSKEYENHLVQNSLHVCVSFHFSLETYIRLSCEASCHVMKYI